MTTLPKIVKETKTEQEAHEESLPEDSSKEEQNEIHIHQDKMTTNDDQLTKDFLNGDYCLQGVS